MTGTGANILIFGTSVLLMSLKPVLLHHAQEEGRVRLDGRSFLMCAEVMKISLCSVVLVVRWAMYGPEAARLWLGFRHTAAYALPAAIFLVMNCVTVYANSILSPGTFQLLVNIKIMTTAVLGRCVLSRQLSSSAWAALWLLTFSTMLGQWAGGMQGSSALEGEANLWGFSIVFLCALLSALGSLTTEKLLKGPDNHSLTIFATNVHMAAHTIVLNVAFSALTLVLGFSTPLRWPQFSTPIICAFTNETLNGILLSSIMRYADSNAKNFASSFAIFSITGFSSLIFGYVPGPGFFVGAALVVASIALYNRPAPAAAGTTKRE